MIVDIHTHVLPGLDDGPRTMGQTDSLLRTFRASGVDTVVCTSHYLSPHFNVTLEQIDAAFEMVLQNHPGDDWPTLVKGAEVRISERLIPDIRANRVPTLGDSKYVLIEFPTPEVSRDNLELVHELTVRGYQPIMAHPERNLAVQKAPELVDELIDMGVLMQITASYVLESPDIRHAGHRLAWNMLKSGKVHFVASDAHDVVHRPPDLSSSLATIEDKLGITRTEELRTNSRGILHQD